MIRIIYFLLIIFGIFAIIYPNGLVQNMTDSYNVPDLIQAWGIYAITIGLLLQFPQYTIMILILCFSISIIWHIIVANNKKWTTHHKEAIGLNLFAILLCWLYQCK